MGGLPSGAPARRAHAAGAIVGLACAVAWASGAGAFGVRVTENGGEVRWLRTLVVLRIQADGSGDITDGSDVDEVARIAALWGEVECARPVLRVGSPAGDGPNLAAGGSADGANVLAWVEDDLWILGERVLGITAPLIARDGSILEADIAINGLHHAWSLAGGGDTLAIAPVALHEIGHLLGLQHVLEAWDASDPPVMLAQTGRDTFTTALSADDRLGICHLYPLGDRVCTDKSECPHVIDGAVGAEHIAGRLLCVDGTCRWPEGTGPGGSTALGGGCDDDAECRAGLYCQALDQGGICTERCTLGRSTCPEGFGCFRFSDSAESGFCREGPGSEQRPLGAECELGRQCESELCLTTPTGEMFCTTECGSDVECPCGMRCLATPVGELCLPDELRACADPGATCERDGDCANRRCDDGVCCQPSCGDRECGDDGCGGSCGGCGSLGLCSDGVCECAPTCAGRECGDDGCGGSCGVCSGGEPCVVGLCACLPECGERTCGDNGCGGACGTCAAGWDCVNGGCECMPDCASRECGDDGCGGACGTCDDEQACRDGVCRDPEEVPTPFVDAGGGTTDSGASGPAAATDEGPAAGAEVGTASADVGIGASTDSGEETGGGGCQPTRRVPPPSWILVSVAVVLARTVFDHLCHRG